MNKREAEYELDIETRRACLKFCPLIKDRCRMDCMAFQRGWTWKAQYDSNPDREQWFVQKPYCANFNVVATTDAGSTWYVSN
jgi:hypothetical protein